MRVELYGKVPLFFLTLLFFLWNPAGAVIIVEPGPAELPTDVTYIDDEFFMPLWSYPPMELLTILLLLHCPLLAMPFELVYSAGAMAYLGYRTSRCPLDNKKRSRIYACIRDRPGIAPAEIARVTGINRGTTRYHLSRLREAGLVSALYRDDRVGYFRNGDYDTAEKVVCLHLQNGTRRQIFALLLEKPGIMQSELAEIVGISRSTVAWHMRQLTADGLVEANRDGRAVCYTLTGEALAPSGVPDGAADITVSFLPWNGTVAESRADSPLR
ncbi:EPS-associated transcriptional regulator, MarR family [Methanoculleus chikugoensis]|uniref:EPS-associated transcriptional regulator, MarR family n=1 Tax=Methanoculleus chikugoensis TaxID=118126 RepID=A0A1M4MI36_9EURY|nr:winged helix-turn-helix transcriptional regulator [Methanoculleus chikugoensis]NMA23944.1 winged helix-turn-helix transcriptional regulator [Spirochaetales bacterium]SCL74537.1 EPS-associated transcriptional regulator, MarR family [Methanoculleus chikugoensis]